MKDDIQHQVDQLVLEQGEYLPLELLLQAGRLAFGDYEAWRLGELHRLDEALFGDVERVREQLLAAEQYLERRGWQAEVITYTPWPGAEAPAAGQALVFSAEEALDGCFHRCYRPPPDRMQMDLFTDAPAASLANTVAQALAERDPAPARCSLERLYELAPDHARLGELERLVEAAEGLEASVDDPAAELAHLQQTLVPLAETLLGRNARNLLVPLWRRLSAALAGQPYRAAQPELHRSYAAGRAMDWEAARRAVESEADWRTEPVLLQRHARACEGLHQRAAALQSWFELCWRFAEHSDTLETSSDSELRRHWRGFLALDPELPPASFPAWLLLQKPGLTRVLPEADTGAMAAPDSYLTVYRLQHGHVAGLLGGGAAAETEPEQLMAWRARLKEQDRLLFQYYLDGLDARP